jgi:hypothetical protein
MRHDARRRPVLSRGRCGVLVLGAAGAGATNPPAVGESCVVRAGVLVGCAGLCCGVLGCAGMCWDVCGERGAHRAYPRRAAGVCGRGGRRRRRGCGSMRLTEQPCAAPAGPRRSPGWRLVRGGMPRGLLRAALRNSGVPCSILTPRRFVRVRVSRALTTGRPSGTPAYSAPSSLLRSTPPWRRPKASGARRVTSTARRSRPE